MEGYFPSQAGPNRKRIFSQSEVKSVKISIRLLKQIGSYFYLKLEQGTYINNSISEFYSGPQQKYNFLADNSLKRKIKKQNMQVK